MSSFINISIKVIIGRTAAGIFHLLNGQSFSFVIDHNIPVDSKTDTVDTVSFFRIY